MFQNKKVILIICIIALGLGGALYLTNPTPTKYESPKDKDDGVVCTMEAMLCPDGSYVGRSGPKCEFDICPIPVDAVLEDGTL
jgi:hypothetical protein